MMARRTTYAMMGAGLHGYNGVNPCLSSKLLSTYVYPRYLYGLETVCLRQEEINQLNKYGKKILKFIQHLPDRTADEAVYLLLGEVPIQARIERQALILLASIARNGGIERELALRQLSLKKNSSSSWFVQADHILSKYGLRNAIQVILNPPGTEAWKSEIDDAIWLFWHTRWSESAASKSSLRYMNVGIDSRRPHHVWSTVQPNQRDVKAACIKAKLLTGTYTLQSNRARFNQFEVNPTCTICNKEPETREHFLIRCESMETDRQKYMGMLENTITHIYNKQTWDAISKDDESLLQCILDCSKCEYLSPPPSGNNLVQIESITRWMCAAAHKNRYRAILMQANLNATI